MAFRPKYITFDCYGTLTNFDMAGASRALYSHLFSAEQRSWQRGTIAALIHWRRFAVCSILLLWTSL